MPLFSNEKFHFNYNFVSLGHIMSYFCRCFQGAKTNDAHYLPQKRLLSRFNASPAPRRFGASESLVVLLGAACAGGKMC